MKLTVNQLRRIIKEEVAVMAEAVDIASVEKMSDEDVFRLIGQIGERLQGVSRQAGGFLKAMGGLEKSGSDVAGKRDNGLRTHMASLAAEFEALEICYDALKKRRALRSSGRSRLPADGGE